MVFLELTTGSSSSSLNLVAGETKLVQALYDYNPVEQSRNENPEEELAFQEGDYIVVSKLPDDDGYYEVGNFSYKKTLHMLEIVVLQGELRGITGLVPKTFVKPVTSSDIMNNVKYKVEWPVYYVFYNCN